MISKPVRLIKIAIAITILIGIILFAQQQHFHFAFSRDINSNLEKQNMDFIEKAMQIGLLYPLGTGDRVAVAKIIDDLVKYDYIYSIEVRDSKGALIATATSEDVPTEKGVKIYPRTVRIIDDRPVDSLDLDDDSSKITLLGTVKLRLTTYQTQDRLDSELALHWVILIFVVIFIGSLIIAFAIFFKRGTKRVRRALGKISNREYVTINESALIAEIDEIVHGVNALSSTLAKSERDFEKTNRIKQTLIRMLSEELESPTKTLQGLLNLINESVDDNDLDAEIVSYLRACKIASDSVIEILSQLKVFNLLDSENLRYRESTIYPETFFDSLYDEFSKNIHTPVSFDVVAMPIASTEIAQTYIVTDEQKLIVIARNILSNSVKYTSRGSIRVEWSLTTIHESMCLQIRFEDTGIGIYSNNIPCVFEEYFREAQEDTGFGLGLTIAKSYIDVLSGNIEIQSLKNMGTKVEVTIPIRLVNATVPSLGKLHQYDFTALIIDDNENICHFLSNILNQYGVRTDYLRNPTQALTAIAEGYFTLVFIDDHMNQVRGLDLVRHVIATGRDVAIVYMSTRSDENGAAAIINSIKTTGAVVFPLRKPVLQTDVERILRELTALRTTIKEAFARFGLDEKDKK